MSKGNGDTPAIVGPDGRQLHSRPKGIAVLKVPIGIPQPPLQLLEAMAQSMNCRIIVLPFEYELMMGRFATETLISVHEAIHKIVEADKGELGGILK